MFNILHINIKNYSYSVNFLLKSHKILNEVENLLLLGPFAEVKNNSKEVDKIAQLN